MQYIHHMGAFVLKRLFFALLAVAFIGASLPMCAGAAAMQSDAAMSAPMDKSCADCPADSSGNLAKMTCSALVCAGIVALPIRQMIAIPEMGRCPDPSGIIANMTGISLKPDPFPPRATVRI